MRSTRDLSYRGLRRMRKMSVRDFAFGALLAWFITCCVWGYYTVDAGYNSYGPYRLKMVKTFRIEQTEPMVPYADRTVFWNPTSKGEPADDMFFFRLRYRRGDTIYDKVQAMAFWDTPEELLP
jgi:hypothetical protein